MRCQRVKTNRILGGVSKEIPMDSLWNEKESIVYLLVSKSLFTFAATTSSGLYLYI